MGESRNFTALDWVTGEINETLNQARQALEAYVANQDDPTQIRFCLTYLHQVHGILQMVEFYGGALLAEELEKLAQALVDGQVANVQDAHEILMRAILQLPVYLDRVKTSRHDDPGSLLPLLNDLRAVRGGALLTETALFAPNMAAARNIRTPRANISDDKFLDAAKKLRQLYQSALLSIIKERDYDSNLPRLEKVFSNFEKLCQGTRYQPLWQVSLALVEGLSSDSISANVSINNLLRELEKVIKLLSSEGKSALDNFESEELIKNLLYYIAGSTGSTPRIKVIREIFKLENALPKTETDENGAGFLAGIDPDAMRSVVVALTEEFSKIKEVFDSYVNKKEENNEALKKILPIFKQAADTLAVLGQGALRKTVEKISTELTILTDASALVTGDDLMNIAAKLLEVEGSLNSQFNKDSKDKSDGAPPSMDAAMLTAQETVLFECQNGLEQAKDAIVEYIASQWDSKHIAPLPALLLEIRGSLEMVNQRRSARVLGACARYIKEKLIDRRHTPDWQEMDTLADAIAGVEYYLETLDEDVIEEEDTVLAVAEESVANLGYAVARKSGGGASAEEEQEAGPSKKLTKEKLEAMAAEEKVKRDTEQAERLARESEEEKLRRQEKWDMDNTPLFSDDEFNQVATATTGLELESEFGFHTEQNLPRKVQASQPPVEPVKAAPAIPEPEMHEIEVHEPAIEMVETAEPAIEMAADLPEVIEQPVVEVVEAVALDEAPVLPEPVVESIDVAAAEVPSPVEQVIAEEIVLESPVAEPAPAPVDIAEEVLLEEPAEVVAAIPAAPDHVSASTPVASAATSAEDAAALIIDNFEGEFDQEIAEIFIDEMEEVLANIHEFYPQWKASAFKDEASLKEFRRGFHTMKGSGRMAKALSVGELAWAVENMLNRVIDGSIKVDTRATELIEHVLAKVPSMMEAFKNHQPDPDPKLSRRYRLIGEALSKGEIPLPFSMEDKQAVVETAPLPELVEVEQQAVQEPIDWDLWDIFASEAETHLAVADEWIVHAREQSPLPVEPTDPLQRALHTLKGSAYMAELNTIAELATPLEKFVKALRAFQIQVGDNFTNLLTDCVEEIRHGLEQIQQRQPVQLQHKESLLARINSMRLEMTGESGEEIAAELNRTTKPATPGLAKVDPTRFNEFLAGEMDALMQAPDILSAWQAEPEQTTGVSRLLVELKKMGDAAEPAGLHPIVALCRLLSQTYEKMLANGGAGLADLLPVVHDAHEALINFIDELAGGQDIKHHTELENQLQAFIDSPIIETPAAVAGEVIPEQPSIEVEEVVEAESAHAVEVDDSAVVHASTAPAAVAELVDPADFDNELLGIFMEEATELLEQLDTIVADWQGNPSDRSQADALKRVLHTYKGGARMAGLSVLGTLAHELETQLETFSGDADQALFDQIHDYQDRIARGTDRVRELMAGTPVSFAEFAIGAEPAPVAAELPVVTTAEEIATDIVETVQAVAEPVGAKVTEAPVEEISFEEVVSPPAAVPAPATVAPVVSGDVLEYSSDIDPDLLSIFIDEATELLEELDRGIADWQQQPEDRGFVDSLKRTLHTLKGGARMSGLTGLGSLAHDLETYLETFNGAADAGLFSMLHDYQDRIIRGVEQARKIAAGETPQAEPVAAEPQVIEHVSTIEESAIARVAVEAQPVISTVTTLAGDDGRATADILPFRTGNLPRGLNPQADKREAAERAAKEAAPQEMVKISAELIDQLVNLAGETSITRGRVEQQVVDFTLTLNDVDATIGRLQDLLRRMEIETEAQVQSKIEEIQSRKDDFDPLEMDRYSTLQQLTRSLMETSSDLMDLRAQLTGKARETEMILLQQSRINTELQEGLMRSRMVPFSRMVPRLRRIVRQVSGELKKEVDFDLVNIEGEMDRTMLERMVAPLEHMLRNALDHGIEMPSVREKAGKSRRGRVVLSLAREGGDVLISLKDDGGGIPVDKVRKKAIERGMIVEGTQLTDHEVLQFILQAGFSTAEKVTQISGRGVGMDVVHSEIKQLGGSLIINSKQGEGSEFVVRLPFTVSVNRALMVKIGDDLYAVPLNSIEGIVRVSPFELENYYQDKEARFEYAGVLYEVRYLGELLHTKQTPNLQGLTLPEAVILVRGADHSIALHVDQLLGSREIVVKSLGPQFGGVPGLSGATILGDGSVVVILDLMALVRSSMLLESQAMMHLEQKVQAAPAKEVFTVMVVDDSVTVRKVTSRFLEREGFEVVLAKDGADAMLQLQDRIPDVMLLDIEMPRMDGFEVASAVKNTDRLRQIPIIMITSRTGEKHRERAMGIGVERYMGKPFVEEELLQNINQLIAEKVRKSAIAE